jgi:hypothetical protein
MGKSHNVLKLQTVLYRPRDAKKSYKLCNAIKQGTSQSPHMVHPAHFQ